jgi:hypothetical protein
MSTKTSVWRVERYRKQKQNKTHCNGAPLNTILASLSLFCSLSLSLTSHCCLFILDFSLSLPFAFIPFCVQISQLKQINLLIISSSLIHVSSTKYALANLLGKFFLNFLTQHIHLRKIVFFIAFPSVITLASRLIQK